MADADRPGSAARVGKARLRRLQRTGWTGLAGSEAIVRLVIEEAAFNEVVADVLIPSHPNLRELHVGFGADNHVDVRLKSAGRFMPPVTLQLEIESAAVLRPAPAVRFRVRKKGVSTLVASILPMLAKALPPEVRVLGENVEVDLATLLGRWDLAWILASVVGLEIATSPGQLHLALELRV